MRADRFISVIKYYVVATICALVLVMGFGVVNAEAAVKTITIGQGAKVFSDATNVKSSDASIACVAKDGTVIAKKVGTAVITANVSGLKMQKEVKVVADSTRKKKWFRVAADEVEITDSKLVYADATTEAGITYTASIDLKNNGIEGVKNVVVKAKLGDEELTFESGLIPAGGTTTVELNGPATSQDADMGIESISAYSGQFEHTYSYATGIRTLEYATPDTKAPSIRGFVGKNSYNGKCCYMVVYNDQEYDYFKYVKAVDNRDVEVDLQVDTSEIDYSKPGYYKVTYTATDSAGNTSTARAKVAYRIASGLDMVCTDLLNSLIKPNWSDQKKLETIYDFVRGHISYTGKSDKSDWEAEALRTLRSGEGDCFSYYAASRALLSRAGYPNLMVTRVQGVGHHWWNMAYINGKFYHFDACPRSAGGRFCLITDKQLTAYSRTHHNNYIWDYERIPKSGTKQLTSVF